MVLWENIAIFNVNNGNISGGFNHVHEEANTQLLKIYFVDRNITQPTKQETTKPSSTFDTVIQ